MIRVISSRKFRLYSPDRKENIVTEGKNVIQSLPDWVLQDGTFQAARSAGLIQILSSVKEVKEAENSPEKVIPQNAHEEAPAKEEPVEEEKPVEEVVDNTEEVVEEDKEAAKKAARAARRAAKKSKK